MTIDCNDAPSYGIPNFPPNTCNAIPVLIEAITQVIEFACDLSLSGGDNEIRGVPFGTASGTFNTYFDGNTPSNDALMIEGDSKFWYTKNGGVLWREWDQNVFRQIPTIVPTPVNINPYFNNGEPDTHAFATIGGIPYSTSDGGVSWDLMATWDEFSVSDDTGDFADPYNPLDAEINLLFPTAIPLTALFLNEVKKQFYYTQDGSTWTGHNPTINGTSAQLDAILSSGGLVPGVFYRFTDNIHAEGGDVVAQAIDVDKFSPRGWYHHTVRDEWFPMTWEYDGSDNFIVELFDPLWGNYAKGDATVDSFPWTVNDTLGGAWADNVVINSVVNLTTISSYGTLNGNYIKSSVLNLENIVGTFSQNRLNVATINVDRTVAGTSTLANNIFDGSTVTFTDFLGDFLNNHARGTTALSFSLVSGGSTFQNNTFYGTGTITFSTIDGCVFTLNRYEDVTAFVVFDIRDSLIRSCHFQYLSGFMMELFDTVSFFKNDYIGSNAATYLGEIGNGTITKNRVYNDSLLTLTKLDPVSFSQNLIDANSVFSLVNAAAAASGTVASNAITGGAAVTLTRVSSFQKNIVGAAGLITVTTCPSIVCDRNSVDSSGILQLTASAGAAVVSGNTIKNGCTLSATAVSGVLTVTGNSVLAGKIQITAAASGSVIRNVIMCGLTGVGLVINSASFAGNVDENLVMDSTITFGAHTGRFNENVCMNAVLTATKTGAFQSDNNFFRSTTATLTAGATVNNGFYNDGTASFNSALADVDFVVGGDTDANSLYGDASTDSWGFGTNTPTAWAHFKASTTARATARIPVGTAPSSPNEGDIWNDSTQKSMQMFEDGIKQSINGTIFTQTASVTVANTGTETTLVGAGIGTMTLPANFLTVGKTIQVIAGGFYGTDAVAPNMVLRLKLGSTTILQQDAGGTLTAGIGNDRGWMFNGEFTIRAVGAAGNAIGTGLAWFSIGGTAQKSYPFQNLAVSAGFATTGTLALALTADWDTGDPDNTLTCTTLSVVVKN